MKKSSLPLLIIILTGFALRLYRLGAQSLWYDETVSALLARKAIPDLIAHTARDIHPPGYYLLLHGWRQLAGETEWALGFFSVIFGMLLLVGLYRVGRTWFNSSVGLWAAGVVALSPYNLWYAQEVRMYTLGAFLGLAAIYFAGRAIFDRRTAARRARFLAQPWLGYLLAAALGLYTLYYFAASR